MRFRHLAVLAVLVIPVAVGASNPKKLPVCDGKPKHMRTANYWGSILPGVPAVEVVPTKAELKEDEKHPAVPVPPPPEKTSALFAPSFHASC